MSRIRVFRAVMAYGALPLLVVFVAGAHAEQATIYQCKDKNGTVIFSGTPCSPDAQPRVIEAPNAGTGGASARQGIDDLAKQYDARQAQARKEAAETARAEREARAAEAAQADRASPPPVIQNDYYYGSGYGGYPFPGGYPGVARGGLGGSIDSRGQWSVGGYWGDGFPRGAHDRDHDRRSPAPPYRPPESPGISGRFPGGIPGMRQ